MKRYTLLSAALMLCVMLSAQTQQGYVKTKGRLANDGSVIAGTRIPNATIQVKDRTPVVSQADGVFSFPIPANKFYLQNVQKQGYVLTDPEVLSKQHAYSANDLIIVMEDLAQREADRRAIERKISSKLYAQLLQRGEELEALKEQNKITEEKYRELLQQLNQDQDDNEKIIKDMAERYTKMDFDQIDKFNRKVSEYILNGELLKADSMINSKGNLHERIDQLNQQHEANVKVRTDLEKSESLEQRNREDIANDCYSKFEIYKMRHLNDSAAFFIELRAGLDTTNVIWLTDAAAFIYTHVADYDKAMSYYRSALKQTILQHGENCEWTVQIYNNMGQIYRVKGEYDQAFKYYNDALALDTLLSEINYVDIADLYNDLGSLYEDLDSYEEAYNHYFKALTIRETIFDSTNVEIGQSYNNIGLLFKKLGNYDDAMIWLNKAYGIYCTYYDEENPHLANIYNNIGQVHFAKKNYDEAVLFHGKALQIYLKNYGRNHINTATCYNNLGQDYVELGEYHTALENTQNALTIERLLFTDKNYLGTAYSYNNIGNIYQKMGDYEQAANYMNLTIPILENSYGKEHTSIAIANFNIGILYMKQGNLKLAIEYAEKGKEMYSKFVSQDHPILQTMQGKIDEMKNSSNE